jgi:hypothetical protein
MNFNLVINSFEKKNPSQIAKLSPQPQVREAFGFIN